MNEFNELEKYLEGFKKLNIEDKKKIVLKQAKVLATVSSDLSNSVGMADEVFVNKELTEIGSDSQNVDNDYLEALLVLLSSTEKSLSNYNLGIVELLKQRNR